MTTCPVDPLSAAGAVTLSIEALRLVTEALTGAPQRCRYHGTDFERAGVSWGEPRCDSCKQPWRVARAQDAVRGAVAAALARPPAPASVTCPLCGRTSYHPQDVEHGYCGACRGYTSAGSRGVPEHDSKT